MPDRMLRSCGDATGQQHQRCPAVTLSRDTVWYRDVTLDGAFDRLFEESELPIPKASGPWLTVTSPCAVYTQHILFITFHKTDPSVQELNATTAGKAELWDFGIHACKFGGFLLPTTDFLLIHKSLRNKQTVVAYCVWGMLAFGQRQDLLESIWYSLWTCVSHIPSI